MVCTNWSANLSKLSRIKLLSILTNPNHGRIGFIRSHISLPFMYVMIPRCFFVLHLNSPFMYIADEEVILEAALGFTQVRYQKLYPCSFIFFEIVWWWRVRYKIWICFVLIFDIFLCLEFVSLIGKLFSY